MPNAYLILAHSDPLHLQRLTAKLLTSDSVVFIHIDRKSDVKKFQHLQSSRIIFVKDRVPVYWGDFSQVEAILTLINAALRSKFDVERLVLLSGVDYPIKPMAEIDSFFKTKAAVEFINAVKMPANAAGKPIARMNNYVLRPTKFKSIQIWKRLLRKIGIIPRQRNHADYLQELMPFGGSEWWAITRGAGEYIYQFVKTHADVVNFFKNVECPDEAFFQTILMNSEFASRVRRNLTYTDWRAGGSSPSVISELHLPLFAAGVSFEPSDIYGRGPALFARKFNDGQEGLLNIIDELQVSPTHRGEEA